MTETTLNQPWYKGLSKYHWFVFIAASLAWLFDCLDQQLFLLARQSALKSLMPAGTDDATIKAAGGIATMWFVLGWAVGGLIFGAIGDRIGRAKTLSITVLIYSICTGLSAFSQNVFQFELFRFITGLGVGGVFGLSVALVADSLPERSRSGALGLLQSLSAVGNITAGLCSIAVGMIEGKPGSFIAAGEGWKYLFLIGAVPAFLCVFLQLKLKEPEKWVKAREAGRNAGVKFGSYSSLLGSKRWRRSAIFAMLLCIAGVVGLWGVGFFSPELVGPVIQRSLIEEGVPAAEMGGKIKTWTGVNMIIQNVGAFLGMMTFTMLSQKLGRKKSFAIGFVCALAATIFFFQNFNGRGDLWMSGVMGFFQLGLFAGFAIYLPELFPTRLRSTGTSFCYNVGRFIAASGPFTLGVLQKNLADKATVGMIPKSPEAVAAQLDAFREAACWMSLIYLIGLMVLPFLPETKGQPLPEDDELVGN
jgi:MFS family permease